MVPVWVPIPRSDSLPDAAPGRVAVPPKMRRRSGLFALAKLPPSSDSWRPVRDPGGRSDPTARHGHRLQHGLTNAAIPVTFDPSSAVVDVARCRTPSERQRPICEIGRYAVRRRKPTGRGADGPGARGQLRLQGRTRSASGRRFGNRSGREGTAFANLYVFARSFDLEGD
jgi:hypothetical protein